MARLNFTIAIPQPAPRRAGLLRLAAATTIVLAGLWTLHCTLPAEAFPLDAWLQTVLEACQLSQSGPALYLLHILGSVA